MRGATVVRLVAATLATIAVVSGFDNFLRWPNSSHREALVTNRVSDLRYEAPVPPLRFVMTATSLNPADRRVQVSLRSVTRLSDELPLIVDRSGKPVVEKGVLRPEFADAQLEITLSDWALGDTTAAYPLANLAESFRSTGSRQVSVSVPARVNPVHFPNDTYSLDLRVHVRLPRGLEVAARDPASDQSKVPEMTWPLPATLGIAVDERLGQWDFDTATPIAGGPDTGPFYNAHVKAEFSRGWTYWAFVYAVSLMPAVIGLSFFVRTRRRPGATDSSAAMELAAALLALIALRQVFVPTDIVGLTWLDFLLGAQLLAVCWLMAVTYVAEPPPPPAPPAPKPRTSRRRLTPRPPDGAIRPRR